MTGTSLDGADLVMAEFSPDMELVAAAHHPYPLELREQALDLMNHQTINFKSLGAFQMALSDWFSAMIIDLMDQSGRAQAVAIHGQTLMHIPQVYSLQALQPYRVAESVGLPVIADFRSADISLGGQGAPLVPAFHQHLFDLDGVARAVINVGGIANLTYLGPKGEMLGFDVGPGNVLMDGWVQRHKGIPFDGGGMWAYGGTVNQDLLRVLRAEPFFSAPAPKSTGRDLFDLEWVDQTLKTISSQPSPQDVMATLLELTAWAISKHIAQCPVAPKDIILCGGGAMNSALKDRVQELCSIPTLSSYELGIAPDQVEAAAIAWLGYSRMKKTPIDMTHITGASRAALYGTIFQS